jgi:hypothetical protein
MMRLPDNPRRLVALLGLLLAAALVAPSARADEFTLKDGRKISGTIVGYEKDMFRIQTDFGFILIRKDMVVSIHVKPGGENSGESITANPNSGNPASAAPAKPAAVIARPALRPVSRPLNEPLPAHIRERVEGNDYINDTFNFAMYKPPGWRLFEELHREKVSAIVAMASQDEQTLLFVDRQVWSGEPVLSDDRVEANLRGTYQDYRQLSQSSAEVDGMPALRRNFTGVIDGVEWHGVSVRIARGTTVYGIIGLTSAETYRFQQAVFNKIIKSFHFIPPNSAQGTSAQAAAGP